MPEVKGAKTSEKAVTRMKALGDTIAPMPPIGYGDHLLDYFFKVGMVSNNGMGIDAVSFSEIAAWSNGCGYPLDYWEFEVLRELTAQYASELQKSNDSKAPPPWVEIPDNEARKKISSNVRNIFRD